MFDKKTVEDADLLGKTVLVRTDYNVPINYTEEGDAIIMSDFRIQASLPTIDYLLSRGVKKIIIISHLGRPNSVDNLADIAELERLKNGARKYSLRPTFRRLQELLAERWDDDVERFSLNFPMNFHSAPIFSHTRYSVPISHANDDYKIEMLENLRYSTAEKRNSEDFARTLAQISGADLFVQDGFGVVHRSHASTSAITHILPSVAGLLLEKEVSTIKQAFSCPKRPFVAVMGGAKVGDKLPLIERFVDRSDKILIGGAMANTFLNHKGIPLGKSRIELGQGEMIDEVYEEVRRKIGTNNPDEFIIMPTDFAITQDFEPDSSREEISARNVQSNDIVLDLGNESVERMENALENAKTVVWNGTIGYSEYINFAEGSMRIAQKMAEITARGATTIIGGGDTAALALLWQKTSDEPNEFSLISTGGGAALELMSGTDLPGIKLLQDK